MTLMVLCLIHKLDAQLTADRLIYTLVFTRFQPKTLLDQREHLFAVDLMSGSPMVLYVESVSDEITDVWL